MEAMLRTFAVGAPQKSNTTTSATALVSPPETAAVFSSTSFRDHLADERSDDDNTSEPDLIVEIDPLAPDALTDLQGPASDFFGGDLDPDLLDALLSFGIHDGYNQGDPPDEKENLEDDNNINWLTEPLSSSPLPDIELDFGDDNFLIDTEHLEDIFDDRVGESDYSIGGPMHLECDTETEVAVDQDTEDLYRDLANMSLRDDKKKDETPDMPDDDFADDVLPPYLFCQPCTPESGTFDPLSSTLASIDEEQPLANMEVNRESPLVAQSSDFSALLDQVTGLDYLLQYDDNAELMEHIEAGQGLRVEARDSADPFINAFGVVNQFDSDPNAKPSNKERACYTHRETIFGVTFSECGKFCATASQDSIVCIWDVKTNALLTQLTGHSKSYECLRVAWASEGWASQILDRSSVRDDFAHLLATSGADGVVKLWACPDPFERKNDWECVYTLDHSSLSIHSGTKKKSVKQDDDENETSSVEDGEKIEGDDKPQTYALQFIDHWQAFNTGSSDDHAQNSFFMTSSDEFIHFWELETSRSDQTVEILENNKIRMVPDKIDLKEVMSLHFGELDVHGYGVSLCSITGMGLPLPPPPVSSTSPLSSDGVPFGGERNPNNKVYVFDAVYCKANGLLGAALSDGSLRLINGRGICISILNLPGCQSHLTSFCWDSKGTRLATSVATGHLISWNLDLGDVQGQGRSYATCTAIMEGGHQLGRPLFGSRFCGKDENLIVSWCVDGSLCLWDSYSAGNVHAPIAVLRSDPNYSIYAVELSKDTIAVCGGNGDGDFIGIPFYLYTFDGLRGADNEKSENQSPTHESEDDEQSPNKKPKS